MHFRLCSDKFLWCITCITVWLLCAYRGRYKRFPENLPSDYHCFLFADNIVLFNFTDSLKKSSIPLSTGFVHILCLYPCVTLYPCTIPLIEFVDTNKTTLIGLDGNILNLPLLIGDILAPSSSIRYSGFAKFCCPSAHQQSHKKLIQQHTSSCVLSAAGNSSCSFDCFRENSQIYHLWVVTIKST